MAKLLFGDNIADMRGKVAGSVYSRNRYGAIRRVKTSPNNPQTTSQMLVRQSFGSLASSWRGLTQNQRDAWNAATADFPITNVFGQSRILTGLALFIQLNQNLTFAGSATITDPPAPSTIPSFTWGANAFQQGADYDLVWIGAGLTDDYQVLIFATPPMSAGKANAKGKYRLVNTYSADALTGNLASTYNARFAPLTEGQKVFIQAKVVNSETGQSGIPIQTSVIVAAPEP